MTAPITEAVVRAVVGEALKDDAPPEVIAVTASPSWGGPAEFDVEGRSVEVIPCVSVLATREVLSARTAAGAEANGSIVVVLTDRSDRELGDEVLARLWRNRVQNPTGWDNLKQLFRVDTLDSALADERWLVEALVCVAPPRGYAPPTSGYLSRDEAWRAFRKHALRITAESPTLADLLRWAARDEAQVAVETQLASCADEVRAALMRDRGPVAGYVFRLVQLGCGADAIPLGLAADALWGAVDESDPAVLHGRVRFEHHVGIKTLPRSEARTWADAATQVLDEADRRGLSQQINAWLDRAEELLIDLDAIDLAGGSHVLPQALQLRLSDVGTAMNAFLAAPEPSALEVVEAAVARAREHRLSQSPESRERTARAEMALRTCRRLLRPALAAHDDLESLARDFIEDGAWVDYARDAIGEGETVSRLYEAYDRLVEELDELRNARDRAFGRALSIWAKIPSADSDQVRPIERVLSELVAPVAEAHPVLLLVLDGLSHPEAIKLQGDLHDLGWKSRVPGGRALPPTIAAFPTVTAVSRTTLLTGKLREGVQKDETEGFTGHTQLRAASSSAKPPVLFHKKELKVEAGQIAPAVRAAILDPEQRVVGVVVNAVDDHLDKGSQLRLADGLNALKPLRPLLNAASEADRVVIVASDHGHILEHGSSVRSHKGAGERWRPADGAPSDDEVRLEGPRVVASAGAIIAPITEQTRYIAFEKRGYHGGATPQEVLCPVMVLFAGGSTMEGWETLPIIEPTWWNPPEMASWSAPRRAEPHTLVEPSGQASFLAPDGALVTSDAEGSAWITELLESSLWASQKDAAGRAALDDESASQILALFEDANGVLPGPLLAERLDLSVTRARSKLEALKRILNFDGYAVLTVEIDGTGRLDFAKLESQFGIGP